MRRLPIAYGNSCFAKTWTNKTISFDDLCERLSQTIRTTESIEEYPKLSKRERDRVKDKGGFVGGHLKDNRRRRETLISRSMLTLDADHLSHSLLDGFENQCKYAACLYTTHGHTYEEPRARIIIPLTRDVSPDEYIAIARYVTDSFDIDQFDECSYRPHQLMYWPTTATNGTFIFKQSKGSWLDPDEFLKTKPNWQNFSLLPTSSRESTVRKVGVKKQEDPLSKSGIVGAFCRAFAIQEAIEKYLSYIYKPSAVEGRYDYIPADSTAGVVVYDDKFAYSHHASDPAAQMLLNSFDLVRIHLFGDTDDDESFSSRSPSFQKMVQLALSSQEVKSLLAKERTQEAGKEFSENHSWQEQLELDKKGSVKDTLDNIVLILRFDEALQEIAFNCHKDSIDCRGKLPWEQVKMGWNDSDNAALKVYMSKVYGVYSPTKTKDAILAVAAERAFHPIKEYLNSLPPWDGTERVETLLSYYFGSDDNSYTRAVARKTMVAAVSRVYEPGIKFDQVPIIVGPQGIGKSNFFAKLGGKWFSDSLTLTDMKDKSGPEKLQGYWILELGELAGMRKADIETVKSFISRTDDKYRASYGVNVESHLRQSIIVGTTNAETGFLRDITGNRRFWPVHVTGVSEKKPWQLTKEDVQQIWAETLVLYHLGENLFLEGEDAIQATEYQNAAMETDEREGIVREYLETLLPENWDNLDLGQRRDFLSGFNEGGTVRRTRVCNMEIWSECFAKDPAMMRKIDSYEIAAIMQKMDNWEKCGRATFPIYGRQRYYQWHMNV
ncbi:MAG: virulence-associated E family protein [Bacteroidia bacterium]|nr:virulence-associated E family protein [Bacteroidia bacterium]